MKFSTCWDAIASDPTAIVVVLAKEGEREIWAVDSNTGEIVAAEHLGEANELFKVLDA